MSRDKTNIHIRNNTASNGSNNNDKAEISVLDEKTRVQILRNDSVEAGVVDEATQIMSQSDAGSGSDQEANESSLIEQANAQFKAGDVVRERFELICELGSGGMGTVFKALDRRKLEAEDDHPYVAIKLLGENFKQHPKAFVTLQRETKKTQALAHPNIVTVYDFDRDGGVIYMTMEELKGQNLEDLLRDQVGQPLEKNRALAIIRGIANGLIYAHSKGIVHSDLKPGNIFVSEDDHVKLLDFGIARVVDESSYSDRFDVSELGAMTPSYASIDMLEHKSPDPRDDLYALGIIACEMLEGKHPYSRKTATQARDESLSATINKSGRLLKKVLHSAIALDKQRQSVTCEKWLQKLNFATGGYRKWLYSFAVIVMLGMANFAYIEEVKEPEISLSELSTNLQRSFAKNIGESQLALEFGDINGALFYLDKAYLIHSQNNQVTDLIDEIIQSISQTIEVNRLSVNDVNKLLDTLRKYQAFQTEGVESELVGLKSQVSN